MDEKCERVLAAFSLPPSQDDYAAIRKRTIEEIQDKSIEEEGHDCLRLLCFMLFDLGHVEDCELIWSAKMLRMDADCMVDSDYLCGAGCDETFSTWQTNRILPSFAKAFSGMPITEVLIGMHCFAIFAGIFIANPELSHRCVPSV